MYLYHWQAPAFVTNWDSALVDHEGLPRPAYRVVQRWVAPGGVAAGRPGRGVPCRRRPVIAARRRQPSIAPVSRVWVPCRAMSRTRVCSLSLLTLLISASAAQAQTPPTTPPPAPPPAPVAPPVPAAKTIRPGVKAAGLDLGGLTLKQAGAKLKTTFAARLDKNIAVSVAGRRFSLTMKEIDFRLDAGKTARRANIAGLAAAPQPDGTFPVDVPLAISYQRTPVAAFVARVDRRSTIRPRNADVRITVKRITTIAPRDGRSVNGAALRTAVVQTLVNPAAKRLLKPGRTVSRPTVTADEVAGRYPTVLTIDRGNFRLRLFKRLKLVKTYSIAVGMAGVSTPAGRYAIQNKAVNPAWTVPNSDWAGDLQGQVIPGGAPNNPLKARWLGHLQRGGDPRHGGELVDRHAGLARLHPHARGRRRQALRPGAGRNAGRDQVGATTSEPPGSTRPRSPVSNQPSRNAAAVRSGSSW